MATNSITSIKDYFNRHNGVQRINRFDINFSGLPSTINDYVDSESFYPVMSATIGNRALEGVSDNLGGFGSGRIQPRSQLFAGTVQIIFAVSNDNHILKMINAWFNYLYSGGRVASNGGDSTVRYTVPFYQDAVYPVTMNVRLLDPNGNPNSTFTFYEVMPVETQPITMDMSDTSKFVTFNVTFSYKEFIQV